MTDDVVARPATVDSGVLTIGAIVGQRPDGDWTGPLQRVAEDTSVQRTLAEGLLRREDLWDRPLRDVLLGLDVSLDVPIRSVSTRCGNTLMRMRLTHWSQIADSSIRQLREIPSMGADSIANLVAAAIGAWAQLYLSGDGSRQPPPDDPPPRDEAAVQPAQPDPSRVILGALAQFLETAWAEAGAVTIGDALAVGDAAGNTRAVEVFESIAGESIAAALDLPSPREDEWKALFDLDDRELAIARERTYSDVDVVKLQELADRFNVTRERIRQLETRILETTHARFRGSPDCRGLRHLAAGLAREIGPVAPHASTVEAVAAAVAKSSNSSDPRNLRMRSVFLLRAIGPRNQVGTLLATESAAETLALARARVDGLEHDEVIDPAWYEDLLAGLSSRVPIHEQLNEYLRLRSVNGHLVRWSGSQADRAVAVLAARGQPMSTTDLHTAIDRTISPRGMSQQVQSDPRIMRVGPDRYALRRWDGEEYSGIRSEIEELIAEQGPLPLDDVVRTLVERFDVSPTSVRIYAGDPRFVRRTDGRLAIRSDADGPLQMSATPPDLTRGLFWTEGAWCLRVEVTHDTLRGSGMLTRRGVVAAAGLEPELTVGFAYEGGTATFSWARTQPSIGSLRAVAEAHGCTEGDLIFLPLTGPEPRPIRIVRATELDRASGIRRLLLEAGLDPDDNDEDVPVTLTKAIGLPAGADWSDVADRLRERGDVSLAELVAAVFG